ncbi:branched-chain amino acid ABC transporter permease [Aeromicrobium senzhongii]|uniref:Branched-chain amino acid ABC transporter permease n=1 Tax=Aeromicrobium senzhongii TaxID=2663859 RepID=A0ABX6SPK1_9ACTN|nr:branched-chain amino acid ABC transporter permease [Aeromicrobium senzhongii]MTB86866.1 branched-chain amino acid ABC transporter permease [Aeromicrobium senzhongii]QNL93299.1 branched-chain amino acid ABC transporter permease [Aeromicrobium senzhongii]
MRLRTAALFWVMTAGLVLLANPASAETTSPSPQPSASAPASDAPVSGAAIRVRLLDQKGGKAGDNPPPVPNVTVTVSDESDTEIGRGVTNDMGVAAIAIPGKGKYAVSIDESTLPAEVKLTGKKTLDVTVNLASGQNVAFPLNGEVVETTPFAERLVDSLISGVKYGLIIALAALGLSLIFGTTGLTNFSHGELITFGGVAAYLFNVTLGLPLLLAGVLAILAGGVFGWVQDRGLWRPLRNRGTGLIAMMIVSIGLGLLLRNLYQYFFGAGTRSYTEYTSQRAHDFGLFDLSDKEIAIMVIAAVAIGIVTTIMARTRLGKAMRAVSDNPALSASSGMRVDGVISNVWILGTALTALAGVLLGVNSQVNFMMGYQLLLMVFAASVLGGLGTVWGAILGSLIIGIITEVGPLFGVPSSIKEVGALIVLILILLIRPQGILGRAERIG